MAWEKIKKTKIRKKRYTTFDKSEKEGHRKTKSIFAPGRAKGGKVK